MPAKYSLDFKKRAVAMVEENGLSITSAAKEMSIGASSLDKWVRKHRERSKDPHALSEPEMLELKRLRKENHTLRIERDLLKKVATYFAKDSDPK